ELRRPCHQRGEGHGPELSLGPSGAGPAPGATPGDGDPGDTACDALDVDSGPVERERGAEILDRQAWRRDSDRVERTCPPREPVVSPEPVPQLRAVDRLGPQYDRARLDQPGEHRLLPRPRAVRRHADPAGDAPRDRGPPEDAEIGVELRAQ